MGMKNGVEILCWSLPRFVLSRCKLLHIGTDDIAQKPSTIDATSQTTVFNTMSSSRKLKWGTIDKIMKVYYH